MIKNFLFTGYCPTKDEIVSVEIRYVNASAIEDYQPRFIKDENTCPNRCNDCPIWKNAPSEH